jgi:hypothetical protein
MVEARDKNDRDELDWILVSTNISVSFEWIAIRRNSLNRQPVIFHFTMTMAKKSNKFSRLHRLFSTKP